jgi:hypothetical protein
MFKNGVQSKIFECKVDEVTESFMVCAGVRILFGWSNGEG